MKSGELAQDVLVQGLKSGDSEAVNELVKRFSRPLFGVILNYTKNPSDAEEILQDTLLRVVQKISTFREESDIWPWMKRIGINNSIMWLRKQKNIREREVHLDDLSPQFSGDGFIQDSVFRWTVDPEDVALNAELSGELYEAIQSMPFEYRIPMVLRDIEGYPVKQIASVLGLKEATAKTRIHRARLYVRDRLTKYLESK